MMVVHNVGNMNTQNLKPMREIAFINISEDGEVEDDKEIAKFIRQSSIITTIHHYAVLSLIMIMATFDPYYYDHWTSQDFFLKPTTQEFYWAFCMTLVIGFYSVTVLLYRAKNISQLQVSSNHCENGGSKQNVDDIPSNENEKKSFELEQIEVSNQ